MGVRNFRKCPQKEVLNAALFFKLDTFSVCLSYFYLYLGGEPEYPTQYIQGIYTININLLTYCT